MSSNASSNHSLATRFIHAGVAGAIIFQLVTSLAAEAPSSRHVGNWVYTLHEYGGLAAFGFVSAFWLLVTVRRHGTEWGRLLPWFSASRRQALIADIKRYLTAGMELRLPPHDEHSALASAVHGLGLLLMMALAATGTLYYFINTGDARAGGLVGVTMFIHSSLGNLAWFYLFAHAGIGVLYHYTENLSLTEMWSFRSKPRVETEVPAEADQHA